MSASGAAAAAAAAAPAAPSSADFLRDSPLLLLCHEILLETPSFVSLKTLATKVNNRVEKRRLEQEQQQLEQQQQQQQLRRRQHGGTPGDDAANSTNTDGNESGNNNSTNSSSSSKPAAVSRRKVVGDPVHGLQRAVTAAELRVAIQADIHSAASARRRHGALSPFRCFWHRVCAAEHEHAAVRSALITRRYSERGLDVITSPVLVQFLPASKAGHFLEIRESVIPFAGLGLFLRRDCPGFPRGGVLCEYTGQRIPLPASGARSKAGLQALQRRGLTERQIHYSVTLRDGTLICGADADGRPLCAGAVANDNGVQRRNAVMQEFWTSAAPESSPVAGKVFLVATRDLAPGEEIYCCYGAEYWGAKTYAEIAVVKVDTAKKQRQKKQQLTSSSEDAQPRLRAWQKREIAQGITSAPSEPRQQQKQQPEEPEGPAAPAAVAPTPAERQDARPGRLRVWQRRELEEQQRRQQQESTQSAAGTSTAAAGSDAVTGAVRRARSEDTKPTSASSAVATSDVKSAPTQRQKQEAAAASSSSGTAAPARNSDAFVCSVCSQTLPRRLELVHPLMCNAEVARERASFSGSGSGGGSHSSSNSSGKCEPYLPRNEFTTVVRDHAAADGLPSETTDAQRAAREDWCLTRACAFAVWNDVLTHATIAHSDNDDDDDDDDDDGGAATRSAPKRGAKKSAAAAGNALSSAAADTDDDAGADTAQRATFMPTLRGCERIASPAAGTELLPDQ